MNFTREPIVESVVTPREGCKLVIRNSKAGGQEEYFVDAVEVIRFGSAIFFRSLERPKSFLLPVNDYEVLEVRETRVVLKHATIAEKGNDRPPRVRARAVKRKEEEPKEEAKPKRRRQRRRRGAKDDEATPEDAEGGSTDGVASDEVSKGEAPSEGKVAAPRSALLPPPTTLISENMNRYREMVTPAQEEGAQEEGAQEEGAQEKRTQEKRTQEKRTEGAKEAPVLVAPIGAEVEQEAGEISKGLGIFSAGRFLRRLAGGEARPEAEPTEE